MTGSPRTLGLVLALSSFTAPALVHAAPTALALPAITWQDGDVETTFKEGVEQLRRGHNDEALKKFREVLAKNPTGDQAYKIWNSTDSEIWQDMLVSGGEMEMIAKRLMNLVKMGRKERKNDAEAIKKALTDLRSENSAESRKARLALASDHGEYAVGFMLPTLAEQGSDDRRILYMHTLTEMDSDVVIPLIEALNSPDPFLRRNVAYVLGNIGDPRAAGMLAHLAKSDTDGGARSAAEAALAKCKSSGDALTEFLKAGEDYSLRHDNVLSSYQYSDVVWNWTDKGLVSNPVPREVYNDELAKKNYMRALAVDANSLAARAGLARSYADEGAKLSAMKDAGQDVAAMSSTMDNDAIQLGLVGPDALDAALSDAVKNSDSTAGQALIRALAACPNAPTAGLMAALASNDGAMRSESAVVLGNLSVASHTPASPQVIAALGEAAGREVVRTVFVIEPNAEIRNAALAHVDQLGFASMGADRGANGLVLLHRVPGVDAVIVSETLPDITTFQVIDELRADPRFEKTPIFVLSANAEQGKELYGALATGVVASGGDLAELGTAMGALTGDRATADRLAAQASTTLGAISRAGGDISPAVDGLVKTLANREDAVTVPAMATLGMAGGSGHVAPLVAVLGDAKRSEAARTAAADALNNIFSRGASASPEDIQAMKAVLSSDAPLGVRISAGRALGRATSGDTRAELIHSTRTAPAQN
ncbi:MAG TPA: HEAT repeat domain-containing protein [Planctomycetota bacterium]|nr:HEAT repeat domain-containing protein [Planctomycetota bacterium]